MSPFALCIATIVALSLLGLPIGHAMIAGSILYLLLAGLDIGTAAESDSSRTAARDGSLFCRRFDAPS